MPGFTPWEKRCWARKAQQASSWRAMPSMSMSRIGCWAGNRFEDSRQMMGDAGDQVQGCVACGRVYGSLRLETGAASKTAGIRLRESRCRSGMNLKVGAWIEWLRHRCCVLRQDGRVEAKARRGSNGWSWWRSVLLGEMIGQPGSQSVSPSLPVCLAVSGSGAVALPYRKCCTQSLTHHHCNGAPAL